MIIKADEEAAKAIQMLCDAALKMNGLRDLNGVTQVLQAVKPLENPVETGLTMEKEQKKNG